MKGSKGKHIKYLLIAVFVAVAVGTVLFFIMPKLLANILACAGIVAFLAGLIILITLVIRLLANLVCLIVTDKAKIRPVKGRVLMLGICVVAYLFFSLLLNAVDVVLPLDPEEMGSFTDQTTISSDGKYRAEHTAKYKSGETIRFIRVDIYDNASGELMDSFYPARAFDFWGVCWEEDSHNLWIQSGDIGVVCYASKDGKWVLDEAAVRPPSVISKYD